MLTHHTLSHLMYQHLHSKCVIIKLIKFLADDSKAHLNLHKMSTKAKTDEIIFHSLNLCLMDKSKQILTDRSSSRVSCMSAHVYLNTLTCQAFYLFFATSLINSIRQEHEHYILFII